MDGVQAPVQAMATAQPSSPPSSAPAQTAAYQQTTAPAQTPSPSAPMQADNGWAAAQQLISGLIATPQYQPQAPYSAPTQPGMQPTLQPTYGLPQGYQQPVTQAWQQPAPTYSPVYQAPIAAPPTPSPQPTQQASSEGSRDSYLSSLSDESIAVLQHFGPEAPALLNRYSVTIEEALLAQANQTVDTMQQLSVANHVIDESQLVVHGLIEDNQAYQELCTNKALLADYVNTVMGPGGPLEELIPADALAADVAAFQGSLPSDRQMVAPAQQQAQAYQRPQFAMQPPGPSGQGNENPAAFWDQFSQFRRSNPSQAYRMLQMATPQQLASRALVSEDVPYSS